MRRRFRIKLDITQFRAVLTHVHTTSMPRLTHLALCIVGASAFAPARSARASSRLFGEYGASSTSFYTTTEKQDSYDSLDDVLAAKCPDEKTRMVIYEMLDACADITEALRSALVTVEGSSNTFGDAQQC